jgi:hypothetical protein
MSIRRFLMIAVAGLILAGASVSPAISVSSQGKQESTLVADGWPEPTECGLYDICRVAANS